MSIIITVNTPWLMMVACALRRQLTPAPVHVLLVTKGDAPVLRRSFAELTRGEPFASISVFAPGLLSGTFSSYVGGRDLVRPDRAKHLIVREVEWLRRYVDRIAPRLVLVGNKHHAPERALLGIAETLGARTGFIEEGLSIYQARNYWDPNRLTRRVRQLVYHYHGVGELYGTLRHRFDQAFVSLPERYPHRDANIVAPLFARKAEFMDVATELLQRANVLELVAGLRSDLPVVLSQRLAEDGLVSEREEQRVLAATTEHLLATAPAIYFKPHPRDRTDKVIELQARFGRDKVVLIDSSQVPLEAFLSRWKPSIVVGYMTASLVYAPLLFDIPSATIAPYLRGGDALASFTDVVQRCRIPTLPLPRTHE
jgi:hypothetical protein